MMMILTSCCEREEEEESGVIHRPPCVIIGQESPNNIGIWLVIPFIFPFRTLLCLYLSLQARAFLFFFGLSVVHISSSFFFSYIHCLFCAIISFFSFVILFFFSSSQLHTYFIFFPTAPLRYRLLNFFFFFVV
jgi:hypothetical protein